MTSKYRVVLPKESILNGDFYEFSSVMDILPTAIDETCLTQFPSSYYVTCLHHGAYHFVHNAFERMMEFINENSYEVAGDAIITPIHDVWASTSDKEYLTEIQIPISRS